MYVSNDSKPWEYFIDKPVNFSPESQNFQQFNELDIEFPPVILQKVKVFF